MSRAGTDPLVDHLEDADEDGRKTLKCVFRKWDVVGMDWIDLAQDRDSWRTLVNAVMNSRVPQKAGNFLTSWSLLASQEGLCSMELVSQLVSEQILFVYV